jgi:hypothetical protein
VSLAAAKQGASQDSQRSHGVLPEAGVRPRHAIIEPTFFVYRDSVGGRSCPRRARAWPGHHGVLPYVARRPGLTIAEVLDILRLPKQNLNRVLKEMHRDGIERHHQLDLRGEIPAREAALLQPKRSPRRFGGQPEPAGPQAPVFPLADRGGRGSVETTGLGGALCTGGSPQ